MKEQSWYNNLIDSCHWSPEDMDFQDDKPADEVTQEEVNALLSGAHINVEALLLA